MYSVAPLLVKLSVLSGVLLFISACSSDELSVKESLSVTTQQAVAGVPTSEMIEPVKTLKPNVSQQFIADNDIEQRLAKALPEIPYHTENLSEYAQKVNAQTWQINESKLTPEQVLKIQALLNWHHHKVGALDGSFSDNTIKAMNVFQYKHNLPLTSMMNAQTWQALTQDESLLKRPVLVNYTLTADDVALYKYPQRTGYKTVREAIAERFQMSRELLKDLNPTAKYKAGETIIVYNPAQPNVEAVAKVIADKKRNILFAYNAQDELIASYPTTVGGRNSPSPKGTYKVINRHIDPSYNKDFKNKASVIPPGPNNPVGRVWMGLNKPSFGIHGSPEPEKISRQGSAGCVRLTNWDALSLFGTIQEGAVVEFVEKDYIRTELIEREKQKLEKLKQELGHTSAMEAPVGVQQVSAKH